MIYPQMEILETQNCILRPIKIQDYKDIYEYYKIPEVVKFLPIKYHKNYSDTKRFINSFFVKNYKKGKIGHYAVVYKKNNRVIGNVGFNNISKDSTNGEIGICLNPSYWGHNLSIELATSLIDYGFYTLNLEYIYAITFEDNIYSQRILNKLKFTHYEDFQKKFINVKNKIVKCSKFVIYRKDYEIYKNK